MIFEVRDLWPALPIAMGALNGWLSQKSARWLEKLAYRNASRVVALSPAMAEGVANTGYDRRRVTVIPNASDLDLFDVSSNEVEAWIGRHPQFRNRALVTYTGTFGRINGVNYLVKVASHMQHIDPNIAFLLVGSGAEEQLVRESAEHLGLLNRNVFIMDRVPKNDIPLILGASTIVTSLFVPLKEMEANSANKFFDGLAAGRPVAINYGGWQKELLESYDAGLHLSPSATESAAVALRDAIRDHDRQVRMGENARGLARERFSRDLLASELVTVIQGVSGVTDPRR